MTITLPSQKGAALNTSEFEANHKRQSVNKVADYTITIAENRDTVEFNGASLTATLPSAATISGASDTGDFQVTIINLNATALAVARNGTDTMNGATTYSLAQYEGAMFKVNAAGNGWDVSRTAQLPSAVAITGGTVDGVVIGGTTPAAGAFTTLSATGGTVDGTVIGGTAPAAGAFTTLSASSTVSGTGFSTYLASPPAIGGTAPAAGTFTTLNATGGGSLTGTWSDLGSVTTVDINGGSIDGAAIGASSASTGAFTNLSASSTVSGTGFSTYLASPPAIGGTAPAAGSFTTLTATNTIETSEGAATGYLRVGPGEFIINSAATTPTALTVMSVNAIPVPSGSSAKALLVRLYYTIYGQSSAPTSHQIVPYTLFSSSSADVIQDLTLNVPELVATSGILIKTSKLVWLPVISGNAYIYYFTRSTGSDVLSYVIEGYRK